MKKNVIFLQKDTEKTQKGCHPMKMAAPINEDGRLYLCLFLSWKTLTGSCGVCGTMVGSSHLGIFGSLGMGWDWQQQELTARAETKARTEVRIFMKRKD